MPSVWIADEYLSRGSLAKYHKIDWPQGAKYNPFGGLGDVGISWIHDGLIQSLGAVIWLTLSI